MKRLVVVLLVLLVVPVGLRAQADRLQVTGVRFLGNESFSDQALAGAIATRQTECRSWVFQFPLFLCPLGLDWAHEPYFLEERSLARDLARIRLFYYERGFREATVDTAIARPSPEEIRIRFLIQEGRPVVVDSLTFEGLSEVTDSAALLEDLPLDVGDPLSGVLMDAGRDSIRIRLQNRGYAHADVLRNYFIAGDDPYAARVTYDVYTGPRSRIGPLTIVGNQETSEQVVRQMLPFLEGSLYRQDQIFEAQRNLYNLEIFTYAEIRPDLDHEPDSIVPLRIQVNEGDVHRVRAGAGWNNGDCLNSEARWISRNFRGGARRLQLRGRISNVLTERFSDTFCNEAGTGRFGELNWLLALDFSQPWIFSARNSLNLGIYGERQSLKNIYVREAVGATAGITRNVGRAQTLTVGWEPELSELEAAEIFFCTGFQVCEPDDIAVLSGANWLSPVRLSYSQDRRDQVLNPTEGYSFSADLEHASTYTGSNYAYHRAVGEVNGYWSVDEGWVVAGRVRAGWLEPLPFGEALGQGDGFAIAHPEKRFYAGGSNSVRGYAENQLGPQNLSIQVADLILPRDTLPPVCTPQEVLNLTCDPGELPDTRFVPRPTGGSQLLEGNLEFRFPFLGSDTQAVVFLDYGYVWPGRGRTSLSDLKFTPGLGFRYFTPIGPLRIDVGYQIEPGERIQVVTEQLRPVPADDPTEIGDTGFAASDRLALLQPRVLYDSIEDPWDLGRFQVHFSLGQAF